MAMLLLMVGLGGSLPGAERPNFLIILADDLGYETLGAYGGTDFQTPELDTMAAEGVRLASAYTSPVCTPSRVSFHTGLYTADHGKDAVIPVHRGTSRIVDLVAMPSFAQVLRDQGYATATTGKWQLATLCKHPEHIRESGFDSWCIWQIWDCATDSKTTRFWDPFYNRDGAVLTNIANRFGPDVLQDYVVETMTAAQEAGQPFLIVHNMLLPHVPIVETPADREAGRSGSLGGLIAYMDLLVGDLLDEIEALGLRDNTYVFFIGDNGTESKTPRHTVDGPEGGGKRDLNDAGTHIPFIVWGPCEIGSGRMLQDLVDITDVFPTVCDLAGVRMPDELEIRGISFAPQLLGQPGVSRGYVHGGIRGKQSVFDGDWRLIDDGRFFDSRHLPEEVALDPSDLSPKAEEAKERLQAILDRIKRTSLGR